MASSRTPTFMATKRCKNATSRVLATTIFLIRSINFTLYRQQMKFTSTTQKLVAITTIALTVASCGDGNKQAQAEKPAMPKQTSESLAIRYVDADTLMARYNLAKDFNEAGITMQNNYDAAQKTQAQAIQSMESEFQAKEKRNVYATDPTQAKADQARYQRAMADAQKKLSDMQANMAKQAQQNNKQLLDSINNYMTIYAKEKGYDMILNKAATFYIDPKFDVTDEVVKGLNKRYTKVAKKK